MNRRTFLSSMGSAAPAFLLPERARANSPAATDDHLTSLTLSEAATRVRSGDVSPVELTRACLARIERFDATINAFITLTPQLALDAARAADKEIRNGRWRGPLHGIPIGLKDQIDTANVRTTRGSMKRLGRIPTRDAEVVRRLKQAGAVPLGKLNMGVGIEGWGPVRNPWASEYECGYSSSGAGAAVAAGFCFGALGTDGAGSVRLPASACGVVGLKPTYGLVSNRGTGESPMGHVGPLSRSVLDAALLLEVIAGHDPQWTDSTRAAIPKYSDALATDAKALRVAIAQDGFFDDLDAEVSQLVERALDTLRTVARMSHRCVNVPLYWEIYQGINADALSPEYSNARRALAEQRVRAADLFADDVDLLVLPTWKRLPMPVRQRQQTWPLSELELQRELWNTVPFNVLGLPAISVPCGFSKHGLPVGLQIVGRPLRDDQVLALAHAYERATDWHLSKPRFRVEP